MPSSRMRCPFISIVSPSATRAEPDNGSLAAGGDADPKHIRTENTATMKRPLFIDKHLKKPTQRVTGDPLLKKGGIREFIRLLRSSETKEVESK